MREIAILSPPFTKEINKTMLNLSKKVNYRIEAAECLRKERIENYQHLG